MKRTGTKSDSTVNLSNAQAFSPMPRYGGEVLFQSTSDLQQFTRSSSENRQILNEEKSDSPKLLSAWNSVSIPIKIFIGILSGCLSSIPFEMMMRIDVGSGMFAAFFLHIYTVIIGLPKAYRDGYLIHSKMPIYWHVMLVGLSFLFIVFKTAAVESMPMPLFIVGSNLQLVAGVVIGYAVDGYRYSAGQMFSVLCVTFGCIIVTVNGDNFISSKGIVTTLFGLLCITVAVSILSFLVSASNIAVKRYDAGALEQMFRQHLFSIPLFSLQWNAIAPRFQSWAHSRTVLTFYGMRVPLLYALLLCTTVFAQLNRYMSTNLAIEAGPLESQLVCAATKTIVLLVSLLYFNAPPYPSAHIWAGVVLQLFGSLLYAQLTNSSSEKDAPLPFSRLRKLDTTDDDSGTDNEYSNSLIQQKPTANSPLRSKSIESPDRSSTPVLLTR